MKTACRLAILLLLLTTVGAPKAGADELLIFAASSLRLPFTEIGLLFKERTGQKVIFNFAGSQTLRTQIEFGAPADLYAAANPESIKPLIDKGLVEAVRYFASNRLIILLAQQAGQLDSLGDLGNPDLQFAIGNNQVPIGKYTRKLLANLAADPQLGPGLIAAIKGNVRTEESSVKAIVTKVLLGEVDAGIVYQTDLTEAVRKKTGSLQLPEQQNPFVYYPAAVIKGSQQPGRAHDFLDLLLSEAGQKTLQQHGFLAVKNERQQ